MWCGSTYQSSMRKRWRPYRMLGWGIILGAPRTVTGTEMRHAKIGLDYSCTEKKAPHSKGGSQVHPQGRANIINLLTFLCCCCLSIHPIYKQQRLHLFVWSIRIMLGLPENQLWSWGKHPVKTQVLSINLKKMISVANKWCLIKQIFNDNLTLIIVACLQLPLLMPPVKDRIQSCNFNRPAAYATTPFKSNWDEGLALLLIQMYQAKEGVLKKRTHANLLWMQAIPDAWLKDGSMQQV